jgi:hypothetical protein
MRALSIGQHYAELILRGIKTVEYRSRPTRIIGERGPEVRNQRSEVRAENGTGKVLERVSEKCPRQLLQDVT